MIFSCFYTWFFSLLYKLQTRQYTGHDILVEGKDPAEQPGVRGQEQDAEGGEGVRAVPLPAIEVRNGQLQGAGAEVVEQDGAAFQHRHKTP